MSLYYMLFKKKIIKQNRYMYITITISTDLWQYELLFEQHPDIKQYNKDKSANINEKINEQIFFFLLLQPG